jgi:hypothetical protein
MDPEALGGNMQALVKNIYNAWVQVPAGVRAGISLAFAALIGLIWAFNWALPTDWAGAKEQIVAFWVIAAPVLWGIFQKSIWPPLFAWLLQLLALQQVMDGRTGKFTSYLQVPPSYPDGHGLFQ